MVGRELEQKLGIDKVEENYRRTVKQRKKERKKRRENYNHVKCNKF